MIPKRFLGIFIIMGVALGWADASFGAIATIEEMRGKVIWLSARDAAFKKPMVGMPLEANDMIQTEEGEVTVAFSDGAKLKVKPWSSAMIQEQEERDGGVFGLKKMVRRVTCFVGVLWFKSGQDRQKKNILQTPTAVAALRSSEMRFGYDNVASYILEIEGAADIFGPFLRGDFPDLGMNVAQRSDIYQKINQSFSTSTQAVTPQEKAAANVAVLKVVLETVMSLAANPYLSEDARAVLHQIEVRIEQDLREAEQYQQEQGRPTGPTASFDALYQMTGQSNQLETQTDEIQEYQIDKKEKPSPSPSF